MEIDDAGNANEHSGALWKRWHDVVEAPHKCLQNKDKAKFSLPKRLTFDEIANSFLTSV